MFGLPSLSLWFYTYKTPILKSIHYCTSIAIAYNSQYHSRLTGILNVALLQLYMV